MLQHTQYVTVWELYFEYFLKSLDALMHKITVNGMHYLVKWSMQFVNKYLGS